MTPLKIIIYWRVKFWYLYNNSFQSSPRQCLDIIRSGIVDHLRVICRKCSSVKEPNLSNIALWKPRKMGVDRMQASRKACIAFGTRIQIHAETNRVTARLPFIPLEKSRQSRLFPSNPAYCCCANSFKQKKLEG